MFLSDLKERIFSLKLYSESEGRRGACKPLLFRIGSKRGQISNEKIPHIHRLVSKEANPPPCVHKKTGSGDLSFPGPFPSLRVAPQKRREKFWE